MQGDFLAYLAAVVTYRACLAVSTRMLPFDTNRDAS